MPPFGSSAVGGTGDTELVQPPTDSISSIAFSPTAQILAVASWSNEVRFYEVSPLGQSQAKALHSAHQGPVLDVCWTPVRFSLLFFGRHFSYLLLVVGPAGC